MSRPVPFSLSPGRVVLVLGALYLLLAVSWPGAVHFSADCDAKQIQVLSFRLDHGLHVDYPWPGRTIDPELRTLPLGFMYTGLFDREIRFAWPLPFAFLSWPYFALFGPRGLFLLPVLTGAASAYVTGRVAERLRQGSGVLATALAGLATPMFFYSTLFSEHLPALFFALVGLYAVVSAPERGGGFRLILAGAALATAAGAFRSDFYVFIARASWAVRYRASVMGGAFFAWKACVDGRGRSSSASVRLPEALRGGG